MLIMDQVLGCENEFLNSQSSKGADVCADDCPVYDRDICCICWWPRRRAIVSLESQERIPEAGPEAGSHQFGKVA